MEREVPVSGLKGWVSSHLMKSHFQDREITTKMAEGLEIFIVVTLRDP